MMTMAQPADRDVLIRRSVPGGKIAPQHAHVAKQDVHLTPVRDSSTQLTISSTPHSSTSLEDS